MQNTTIENIVSSYAKANKYSKAKLQSMADEIMQAMPKNTSTQGKPVSEQSQQIRDMLRKAKGETFTSKDIAKNLNVSPTTVNNNLRYLMTKEGIAQVVGKTRTGARGKHSLVWQIS